MVDDIIGAVCQFLFILSDKWILLRGVSCIVSLDFDNIVVLEAPLAEGLTVVALLDFSLSDSDDRVLRC